MNASAATAQEENNKAVTKMKAVQQASLLAQHVRSMKAASKASSSSSNEPFRWDRDAEMGLRPQKDGRQLHKEIQSAFASLDRFV